LGNVTYHRSKRPINNFTFSIFYYVPTFNFLLCTHFSIPFWTDYLLENA